MALETSWKYPTEFSSSSGFKVDSVITATDSEILLLFDTMKGERAIFKDWGSRLRYRISQTRYPGIDEELALDAAEDIKENIDNAEPIRVDVRWIKETKTYEIDLLYVNLVTGQERNLKFTVGGFGNGTT